MKHFTAPLMSTVFAAVMSRTVVSASDRTFSTAERGVPKVSRCAGLENHTIQNDNYMIRKIRTEPPRTTPVIPEIPFLPGCDGGHVLRHTFFV